MKKIILFYFIISVLFFPFYSCNDQSQEKGVNKDYDTRTEMDNEPTIYQERDSVPVDSPLVDTTIGTSPKY